MIKLYNSPRTHPYFLYDPEQSGFEYFATPQERDAVTQESSCPVHGEEKGSCAINQVCAPQAKVSRVASQPISSFLKAPYTAKRIKLRYTL